MLDFFTRLFDTEDFPSRWNCGNWTDPHGYLHIISDVLIFSAYMMIPIALAYFLAQRKDDIPFPRVIALFGVFIVSCGVTHLNEVIIFWAPIYRFAGVVKLITAVVSLMTVVALLKILPLALTLRTPAALELEVAQRTEDLSRAQARSAFLAAIVASSDDAVVGTNLRHEIISWNAGAQRLYGRTLEEVLGQPFHLLFSDPSDLDRLAAQTSDGAIGRDMTHLRADDTPVEVSMTLSPVHDENGLALGLSMIARDVTERHRAQAALKASNAELESFSYSVSHDLRGPLRAIDGFISALEEDCAAQLDEDGLHYLKRIRAAAGRMSELIDGLLTLSRTMRADIQCQHTDLSALATEVGVEVREAHPDTAVTLDVAPGLEADCDPRLVRAVLTNLIDNAVKYTHDQPTAHVVFGRVEREGHPWFFVQDDGLGFDMAYQDKLFLPFQRLHDPHIASGNGIGLATVSRIIRRHGGVIQATSKPGEGATFFFTLAPFPTDASEEPT